MKISGKKIEKFESIEILKELSTESKMSKENIDSIGKLLKEAQNNNILAKKKR